MVTTQPESGTPAETSEDFGCGHDGCPRKTCGCGNCICFVALGIPLPERCHCGQPVTFGFDGHPSHHRGMCAHCDPLRCDVDPGVCRRTPAAPSHPEGETVGVEALAEVIFLAERDAHPNPQMYAATMSQDACANTYRNQIKVLLASGLVVTEEAARAREAQAAAGALRSAADTLTGYARDGADGEVGPLETADWLNRRADTIDGSA